MIENPEHKCRLEEVVHNEEAYPSDCFSGRGIVICAGGIRYFTNAYVCACLLRRHGCRLPIQFWHLNAAEMTDEMRSLVKPLDVETVDAAKVREHYPVRTLNGSELKAFSILHSRFREVLLLDADNCPTRNPEFLFDAPAYQRAGAVFWPGYGRLGKSHSVWDITGVPYRDEPECDSGQILVDKARCWKALNVAMHFSEWSDVYSLHMRGDSEGFHMAWRKLDQAYAMPSKGVVSLDGIVMVQHDFDGLPVFQHRTMCKWTFNGENVSVKDFEHEADCLAALDALRESWSVGAKLAFDFAERMLCDQIVSQQRYVYIRVGYDFREMCFARGGGISKGAAGLEKTWAVSATGRKAVLKLIGQEGAICELTTDADGVLSGRWLRFEKMPIRLVPLMK